MKEHKCGVRSLGSDSSEKFPCAWWLWKTGRYFCSRALPVRTRSLRWQGGGGSRVINNDPGNVRANQYAALLESGFEASESVPETQLCRVHLIDARPSFDQAGNEKLRIYFVLTNHEGVVMSADTCGLPVNECVALISRRSREECRLPDRRSIY